MRLVLFSTTLRHDEVRDEHREMVESMRELAEATPGFVAWHDVVAADPDTSSGVIVFDSEESLAAWREHPDHGAVHQRGEDAVYRSFDVQIYELVRENTWRLDDGAEAE